MLETTITATEPKEVCEQWVAAALRCVQGGPIMPLFVDTAAATNHLNDREKTKKVLPREWQSFIVAACLRINPRLDGLKSNAQFLEDQFFPQSTIESELEQHLIGNRDYFGPDLDVAVSVVIQCASELGVRCAEIKSDAPESLKQKLADAFMRRDAQPMPLPA